MKKTKIKFSKPTSLIPSIIISIFIIRQIFTPYPLASAWYLCKMIELSLLTLFLIDHRRLFSLNSFKWTVVLTLIFQSSLSWWQFITQRSLYGFILLGEPNLSHSIGLAKDLWWQTGRVLPYGTTAHPNILGGTIVVLSLLLIRVKQSLLSQSEKNTVNLVIIISCITLVLTQSISALLSFIIGILILTMPKIDLSSCKFGGGLFIILIPLLISFAASKLSYDDSLTRRSYLQTAAVKMTINHPLAGVGLNQFTARVEEYSPTKEIVRFVQPVHHIGLLFLAETGILGIMILGIMMRLSQIYPKPNSINNSSAYNNSGSLSVNSTNWIITFNFCSCVSQKNKIYGEALGDEVGLEDGDGVGLGDGDGVGDGSGSFQSSPPVPILALPVSLSLPPRE